MNCGKVHKVEKFQWVRMASGDSASSLAMYERDMKASGLPVKVEKDVTGRFVIYQYIENRLL
jgi:hypothetical protein